MSTRDTPATTRAGLILALVCAGQFMVVLDVAIVNVALPSIQLDLGVSQNDLQWAVVAYGIFLGGFLLLGGRAADLLGRRKVFVTGVLVFAGSSLVAGLSTTLGVLVVARGAQGFGAALTASAALSILTATFEEGPARTKALGIWGAISASGRDRRRGDVRPADRRPRVAVDLLHQRAGRDRPGGRSVLGSSPRPTASASRASTSSGR